VENSSRQQTSVAKGTQTSITHKKANRPRHKTIWHWLIKHPVEFSKNNHTPKTCRLGRRPVLGALVRLYPRKFPASNPGFPGVAR
jgi:hypothetical protein